MKFYRYNISFMRDECVHVELHRNLIRTDLIQALQTREIWAHAAKSESGYRYEMADEDFYAFHIEHMKNHFCTGGCGVRFFLDMWVLKHCRNFDETQRAEKLRDCGLEAFEVKRFCKMIADGRWNRTVTELKANRSVDQETRQKIRGMLDELNLVDGQWSDALKK